MKCEFDAVRVLRESTRTRHEAVERLLPLFRPDFTVKKYVRVLEAFLGFFEPLEERLEAVKLRECSGIRFAERRRSHLLRRDLEHFGLDRAAIECLPRCADLPSIVSCEAALGALYVLEGSTLGGQMIVKELAARLGIGAQSGMAFFASEGRDVAQQWRELCSVVRATLVSEGQAGEARQSAELTFDCLARWLQDSL